MGQCNHKIIVISAVIVLLVGACTVEPTDQAARVTTGVTVEQEQQLPVHGLQTREELGRERMPGADEPVPATQAKNRMDYSAAMPVAGMAQLRAPAEPVNREIYAHFSDNPLHRVADDPFSTFSIDVDTGAYSNMRRMLNAGNRPLKDAIRTEELIKYFS